MDPREYLLRAFPQLREAILLEDALDDWNPDGVDAVPDGIERVRMPDHFVPHVVDIEAEAARVRYPDKRNKAGKVIRRGKIKRRARARSSAAQTRWLVVHQMGVERSATSKRWKYVTAHRVIRTDAARMMVHPLDVRLYAANAADRAPYNAANIEVAGNFEGEDGSGNWFKPQIFGSGRASLEQLVAVAMEIDHVRTEVQAAGGGLEVVSPHRPFGRNSRGEPNRPLCCGSRLWQASEHAALRLRLRTPEPDWSHGGTPIPGRWRAALWFAQRGESPPAGWRDDLTDEEKAQIDRALGL